MEAESDEVGVGRTVSFAGTAGGSGSEDDCRDGEVAYQTCFIFVYDLFSMIDSGGAE